MEPSELSQYDWVEWGGNRIQLDFVKDSRTYALIFLVGVEPIPLTEDILLKNGFELTYSNEKMDMFSYEGVVLYHRLETDTFAVEITANERTSGYADLQRKINVHELQHILRLAGYVSKADRLTT